MEAVKTVGEQRDVCDAACPQSARYRVTVQPGRVLDFCVHHFREHEAAFFVSGYCVYELEAT